MIAFFMFSDNIDEFNKKQSNTELDIDQNRAEENENKNT